MILYNGEGAVISSSSYDNDEQMILSELKKGSIEWSN
jgi:hypothetical protein